MGRLSLCAGKVWVEGVQSVYLPGQAEMWAGRWRELQPGEVGERKGSHLSAGEGKGNQGGAGTFSDAGMISIDCTAVEDEVAKNMYQRPELDYLVYNDPVGYSDLIFNGDPEEYLKNVTDYSPLD